MIYDRLSGINYYYKFWMYVILNAKIIVKLNLVYSNIFMSFFFFFLFQAIDKNTLNHIKCLMFGLSIRREYIVITESSIIWWVIKSVETARHPDKLHAL